MDPINIIVGLNIIATFAANASGAKKSFKTKITLPKEKPVTYLQTLPVALAIFTLLGLIAAVFQAGTLGYSESFKAVRLIGLAVYIFFSWFQIAAFKTLGENYSQDILLFKNHQLITKGPFKFIRHPQYLSQILVDIGGGIATLSIVVIILALIEIPFLILRASIEEKLLEKNFKEVFLNYKKKSGFFIPFIG